MKKHIRHRILILTDTLLEEILCFFACTKDNEKNKWVKFPNLKVPVYFAVTGQIQDTKKKWIQVSGSVIPIHNLDLFFSMSVRN